MKTSTLFLAALLVLATAGGGYWYAQSRAPHQHQLTRATDALGHVYYSCAMHPQVRQDAPGNCPICGMKLIERHDAAAPAPAERQPLYWYDPMRPDQHFDAPGKSPFMDMDLVPKYGDELPASDGGGIVSIDPRMAQNLGLRTAAVTRSGGGAGLRVTGSVMLDERRVVAVEARAAGWVESLQVRAVGEPVKRGQVLAYVYAPELLAAQEELALAAKLGDESLTRAARQRLELLGVPGAGHGAPTRRVALRAPQDGVVTELMVREGEQLAPGMPLMKIADLSQVWIVVEVPEAQAAAVRVGDAAQATLRGQSDRPLDGRVDYVYPLLDSATRTLRARLVFANADGALRPGQYAQVNLAGAGAGEALQVPSEAVIRTGTRSVVLVAEREGRYRPVTVTLGEDRGDHTVVLGGLEEGQKVVVSGQFLIDSEASLLGFYNRSGGGQK